MSDIIPPKPASRPDKVSFWQHVQLFRKDLFASQPERLYKAWMAEFKLPFFRSYFVNQPELVKKILNEDPDNFPKSDIIRGALHSLLGESVFVTNGEKWKQQRRIIDPAFEGGRLRDVFPSMLEAGHAAVQSMMPLANGQPLEIEEQSSKLAADVIFRTLFSIPITDDDAKGVVENFRDYQRTQPLMNLASFFKLPDWMHLFQRASTKKTRAKIRALLKKLTDDRALKLMRARPPMILRLKS